MDRSSPTPEDAAVTEVIGFIMMFALSAIILVFSLRAFDVTQTETDREVAEVQLEALADEVASRVVQAGLASEKFPNATFKVDVRLPDAIKGYGYTVTGTNATVYANTTDGQVTTNSTTFKTDALEDVWVHGTVYSGAWDLEVRYEKIARQTPPQDITLQQG